MSPSPAEACGGFFCDNSQPVNQQAERIIFAQQPDGSVDAVIQIQYQGPSEQFAWMLPVTGSPEISVSSNAAFDRIQQATNPLYRLTTTVEGTCADSGGGRLSSDGTSSADAGVPPSEPGGEVTVVDRGSVGPYDYVLIALDPEAMDLVAVAITWLRDNGYDVPEMSSEVLRPYLESGMNLLTFRLTKGNDAGSIRPVRLSFGNGLPSIPIRPTAVAAQPDMGIMVWVLGAERAIPANYRSLELNEVLINWLRPNSNYNDVVTRAANEANGQGFVTEHSGSAPELGRVIWQDFEATQWADLQSQDWTDREGEFLGSLSSFANLDGMRELFAASLTPPAGVDEDAFLSCITCYIDYAETDFEGLEPAAFLTAMQADVIDPLVETQALFDSTTITTRLYTTMSADEMTMDPVFDFNADLGPVSNQHDADRIIECSPSIAQSEAPWRILLEDGQTIRGWGTTWPFEVDGAMPANSRIVRVGNEGEGEVVEDNVAAISAALTEHNATVTMARGTGCSVSPGSGSASPLFGLFAVALGLVAARRRRN